MLIRTALDSAHPQLAAKLIDSGGWEMPIQSTLMCHAGDGVIDNLHAYQLSEGIADGVSARGGVLDAPGAFEALAQFGNRAVPPFTEPPRFSELAKVHD